VRGSACAVYPTRSTFTNHECSRDDGSSDDDACHDAADF
jgi:hypothetical protein